MRATRIHAVALALMVTFLRATAEAGPAAEGKTRDAQLPRPTRRVVVSIPDRKLAVLENDTVPLAPSR
jgi:hypothetical protein